MNPFKKITFALVTVLICLGIAEGISRVIWWRMESRVFSNRFASGEKALRNDGIGYMKQADGRYGYVLKPGFNQGGQFINQKGFAQRDVVPLRKTPGVLRVIAMGESTTHGHNVDTGNYPLYLKKLLLKHGTGYQGIEMINAGVSGYLSDQVALKAEGECANYRPDVVILYVGWNDFQSYTPYGPTPRESLFEQEYGRPAFQKVSFLKTVTLMQALYGAMAREIRKKMWKGHKISAPMVADKRNDIHLRQQFYLKNMERIIRAYRKTNPDTKIVVSTLVGRWPYGDFQAQNGKVWWMDKEKVTPQQAAFFIKEFNDLIQEFAHTHDLLLVDTAAVFDGLDRGKLQWDFAHMYDEGYELMAEILYQNMLDHQAIRGSPSTRMQDLLAKYRLGAANQLKVNP